MSVQCMAWVFEHSQETQGNRLVLLSIANHANSDGCGAWPGVKQIAIEARLSEREVRYCLRKLEQNGAIVTEVAAGPRGTNLYRVLMGGSILQGAEIAGGQIETEIPQNGGQPTADEPSIRKENHPYTHAIDHGEKKRKSERHEEVRGEAEVEGKVVPLPYVSSDAGFERLRQIYPKRDGAQRWRDAEKHWHARIKEGTDPAAIEDGVLRYAKYCKLKGKEGTEFVQQAATFLGKNRGYENPWACEPASPDGYVPGAHNFEGML